MMLIVINVTVSKGLYITPTRSELLNQWARSGLPASLPFESGTEPGSESDADGVGDQADDREDSCHLEESVSE